MGESQTQKGDVDKKKVTVTTSSGSGWKDTWEQSEVVFQALLLALICLLAFTIRLFSVLRFESVIHEFDPWFNFRSTKYLVSEGFYEFHNWFDPVTWYPLGRNVGGTVYPGLMWTAAVLHRFLHALNIPVDIRNVCVLLAPLMSGMTSLAVFGLTKESWNSRAGIMAAFFAAIVPGYISRSVAGSYDNEAVAIFALILTFYLWVKSVKTGSLFWSGLCALGYFYMVASWGGYIFIINLIPFHVLCLMLSGRFTHRLYVAYTTMYTIGTLLSMQIQFVQFIPVSSPEHMAALGIFGLLQLYEGVLIVQSMLPKRHQRTLLRLVLVGALAAVAVFLALAYFDFIPSLTGRLLTLLGFKEDITIVKSVSEHQPTSWGTFFFDMHMLVGLIPAGIILCFQRLTDESLFIILYVLFSSYFSGIMIRLVLVISPVAAVLGGIVTSELFTTSFDVLTRKMKSGVVSGSAKRLGAILTVALMAVAACYYQIHSTWVTSAAYSSPSIVLAAEQGDGRRVIFDDFREAYSWLSHNTDDDAKVMSWWDYGYQITGMGNRTVLVDNNTRNNTHIATVGMMMASTEVDAYPYLQAHHVDYVLVVFGGMIGYSSDDINKFLWMVRIGGGVYPRIVEKDYFSRGGQYAIDQSASETMRNCLMYKMCYYRFGEMMTQYGRRGGFDRVRGTEVGDKNIELTHLEEAYTTEHWMVRIYRVKRPEELSRF